MCFLPKTSISQPKTSLNWESLPFVLLTPNRFGYVRNEGDRPHLATNAQLALLSVWWHEENVAFFL